MWKGNWRSGWKEKKHKQVLNWSNRLPPLLYFTNDFGICSSLNLTCQVVSSSGSIIFCQVDTYAWVLLESAKVTKIPRAKVTKIGQQECWCLQMSREQGDNPARFGHLIKVVPFSITESAVGGSSMQLLGAASVVVNGNCAYVAMHLANSMVHNWYHHRHERQSERHSQLHPQITSQMSENKLEAPRAEHLCAPFLN